MNSVNTFLYMMKNRLFHLFVVHCHYTIFFYFFFLTSWIFWNIYTSVFWEADMRAIIIIPFVECYWLNTCVNCNERWKWRRMESLDLTRLQIQNSRPGVWQLGADSRLRVITLRGIQCCFVCHSHCGSELQVGLVTERLKVWIPHRTVHESRLDLLCWKRETA